MTPVRELGTADASGVRTLRESDISYRDGAEEAVLRIVSAAEDLSSGSVEMMPSAVGWAQRYHVDPARANVLRGLDLPPTGRVLEIGAGCGAITRYLGETCAVVDALEPVRSRAEAAAARNRDLPGVQVFVGELDDVPVVEAYDVIVVIGVLEYVGNGVADRKPYLDFLAGIRDRLVPGGTLVLAIENELGVKYVVGSPEDHTNRVFDSIEGYPRGGKARTFSRRALEQLMVDSGLTPATRIAFPDYKLTRVVFGDLPEGTRSLLHRIPRFPSPDWRTARPRLADEHAVWRRLVEAGLETEFGNSFLVLAGKDCASELWPAEQAAAFYTSDRVKHLNTATVVQRSGDGVVFKRTSDGSGDGRSDVRALNSETAFEAGTDLTEVLAERGVDAFATFAPQWLDLVDDAIKVDAATAIDVVPHNLIVTEDGALRIIDVELTDAGVTRERVIRHGVFWLAVRATSLAVPERWHPAETIGDVMRSLGRFVGLPEDGSWLEQAIAEEANFLAAVRPGPPVGSDDADAWRAEIEKRVRGYANRRLVSLPFGIRLPDTARQMGADLKSARSTVARLEKELVTTKQRLARSEAARTKLVGFLPIRLALRVRRTLRKR